MPLAVRPLDLCIQERGKGWSFLALMPDDPTRGNKVRKLFLHRGIRWWFYGHTYPTRITEYSRSPHVLHPGASFVSGQASQFPALLWQQRTGLIEACEALTILTQQHKEG